jgi:hypothetical protein
VKLESFRELHGSVVGYEGRRLFDDVLAPALDGARSLMRPLERYRTRAQTRPVEHEDLWELFALSVVNDVLLEPMRVSLDEYVRFAEGLGFETFGGGVFHPIRHEIVGVANVGVPGEGVTVHGTYWPGLKLGELVFSRAGVVVSCHAAVGILEGVADCSPLYFTHQRMGRRAHDLSEGWGSNSRWRTTFARNYDEPELACFNVDGKFDLADARSYEDPKSPNRELPIAARRELLMHRSFVGYKSTEDDWFPYHDVLYVRRGRLAWPLDETLLVPVTSL